MSLSHFRSIFAAGLLSLLCALPVLAQNTMVRVHTTQGPIDIKLLDSEAPITVANFLTYVRAGDYSDVFFHRSVRNFVVQGGGFKWASGSNCCPQVTSRGQIQNEFSAARSNLRGTVAMAKLGTGPNTASSQWFFNLANNASNLDTQNGGFPVFARVTTPGMVVVDKIAALQIVDAGSPFNELPVFNWTSGNVVLRDNLVRIGQAVVLPTPEDDADRVFTYLEAAYPQYLSPSTGTAGSLDGYRYRYYAGSNAYVAVKEGRLYYLVPAIDGNINELGTLAEWFSVAQAAGY